MHGSCGGGILFAGWSNNKELLKIDFLFLFLVLTVISSYCHFLIYWEWERGKKKGKKSKQTHSRLQVITNVGESEASVLSKKKSMFASKWKLYFDPNT